MKESEDYDMFSRKCQSGFTLVEVTIVLLVLAILAAILLPTAQTFIHRARLIRCRQDVAAIGAAVSQFLADVGEGGFLLNGNGGGGNVVFPPSRLSDNRANLLVSDGDIPDLGAGGDVAWVAAVNNKTVDFLERHLVTNNPGGRFENRYRTPVDMIQNSGSGYNIFARNTYSGLNAEFSWRGAYMTAPIGPDPWGSRYAVNAIFFMSKSGNDVVVLSAGPDKTISTAFAWDGLVPGGDDIIYVISGNAF
jgi:prepilin-type N-terminal cleavage/methylation domain-containing protein